MNELSPTALAEAYRDGRARPREVLEDVYSRIEKAGVSPVWISLQPFEAALSALQRAEQRAPRGPLFGVPFGVKDNIDVAGLPTTAACPEFAYVPQVSASVVERLTLAGAIVIGKTNLDQFATGLVGTRSPYGVCSSVFDARYLSGGSSSGSAVAVARGDVGFALGTDTAGSGRVPAAFNALIGVKPTRGLLSTRGVVPACRSLDCVSIFATDLRDAELLLATCAGYDAEDPFSRCAPLPTAPLGERVRLGVPIAESLDFFGDDESARLFTAAVARLSALPAELVPIDLRTFREAASLLYQGPWVAERLAALGGFFDSHPAAVQPVIRGILEKARAYTARDAFEGSYRLAALRRRTEPVWQQIDALVVPSVPSHYTIEAVLADPIELNTQLGTYTNFVNLLDLAALAIPAGFRANGLPFGITLIAPAFADRLLLELAGRASGQPAAAPPGPAPGSVWLAVAGAHLSGQPLNHELVRRGARLLRTTRTAPEYRLYALRTEPKKPGLVHAPGTHGVAVEVEIWQLDLAAFGSFVAEIPAPMSISQTRLADGSWVKGFSCEPHALASADDISAYGGWRAFLARGAG
jgi:allophanate hydrolase